jgi:hypothetical protein
MWLRAKATSLSLNGLGTYQSGEAIHWCGVFATWILKRAGLSVEWKDRHLTGPSSAITAVNLRLLQPSRQQDERNTIMTGDVCAMGANNHHFIVIDGVPGQNRLLTVEGNVSSQCVLRREQKKDDTQIHTIYRLVD